MPMDRRMPVIATTECGSKFARWCHVRVAVQDVTDLIRIFLVDTGQGELCKAFGGGCVEYWRGRVLRGEGERWQQNQRGDRNSHCQDCNRFKQGGRSQTF